jgi:tRNA(Ile)-lysidine synthase
MARESEVYAKWSLEMRRSGLFRPGERVGVAVSGGGDSVLLLDFMRRCASRNGWTVAVIHFNHHLRGAESDADEGFVRALARAGGSEFFAGGADVARVARETRGNLEATARHLRYKFFFGLVKQGTLDKVATAHTASDQAETVLLRLLRGAGTRGLGGIYPVLDGTVVRPFLNLTRAEVQAELRSCKLDFRLDSTNLNTRLARNKVRAKLIPLLEKEFSPAVVRLLNDLAARARDDEAYLEQQARERARPWRVREGSEEKIPLSPLADFHPALARRVLRQMVAGAAGSLRGLTHDHVEALRRFAAEAQSGRRLVLPGLVARKEFDWLVVGPPPQARQPAGFSYAVQVPGAVSVPQLGVTFWFKIVHPAEHEVLYNAGDSVWLDASRLSQGLVLRNWRAGDRFQPRGSNKPLKLKELFRRSKIPPGRRNTWPVLESGTEIIWVKGFPAATAALTPPRAQEVRIAEEPYGPG